MPQKPSFPSPTRQAVSPHVLRAIVQAKTANPVPAARAPHVQTALARSAQAKLPESRQVQGRAAINLPPVRPPQVAVQMSHGKKLYAKCKGTYEDKDGKSFEFEENELLLNNNVTSHGGKTDYEDLIKKALKKEKVISKDATNIQLEEWSTFTRK